MIGIDNIKYPITQHLAAYNHNLIATALQNVVEDLTPQLGGTLDTQGYSIFGGTGNTAALILKSTTANIGTGATISFRVGNSGATTAMTILGNGNVGIGTTNPQAKLDVAGNIRMSGLLYTNSGTVQIYGDGANYVSGTNAKFGIGLASPTYDLSFGGNSARTIWVERTTTAASTGKTLTVQSGGAYSTGTNLAGGDLYLKSGIATGCAMSAIRFFTATSGATGTADRTPTEKMAVCGNGKVKITSLSGTTDRIVQANSSGTLSAGIPIISAKLSDPTTILKLTCESNWSVEGVYIGSAISSTYEGMYYRDANYYFFAYGDDDWIRMIRG